jgi:UDP:flavonoid glycosyltransferase YjiC (YdhE family)
MRVLVVSAPLLGHVFPLVPLGRALAEQGHEVLIATAGDALKVRESGLAVHDLAPGFAFGRIAMATMLRHPLIARAELAGRAGTRGVKLLFGAVNDRLRPGLLRLAATWRPDLVVHEPLAFVPAELGVRRVMQENSLFDGHALAAVPPAATITVAPPSVVGPREGWAMRAVPYSGEGAMPPLAPPTRPRIAVSRSTVPGPGDRLIDRVVAAAAGVDAEFVLVRPGKPVTTANVTSVGWVPVPELLATCAGIVHHGGAGTILAALDAGVPQLVINGAGDRRHNAGLIAARGAGLAAEERDISAGLLTRLVTDPSLGAAAAEVSAEMSAMPPPADLAARVARWAAA